MHWLLQKFLLGYLPNSHIAASWNAFKIFSGYFFRKLLSIFLRIAFWGFSEHRKTTSRNSTRVFLEKFLLIFFKKSLRYFFIIYMFFQNFHKKIYQKIFHWLLQKFLCSLDTFFSGILEIHSKSATPISPGMSLEIPGCISRVVSKTLWRS